MPDTKKAVLAALREADQLCRQIDAHRSELVGLAKRLGASLEEVQKALGLVED